MASRWTFDPVRLARGRLRSNMILFTVYVARFRVYAAFVVHYYAALLCRFCHAAPPLFAVAVPRGARARDTLFLPLRTSPYRPVPFLITPPPAELQSFLLLYMCLITRCALRLFCRRRALCDLLPKKKKRASSGRCHLCLTLRCIYCARDTAVALRSAFRL